MNFRNYNFIIIFPNIQNKINFKIQVKCTLAKFVIIPYNKNNLFLIMYDTNCLVLVSVLLIKNIFESLFYYHLFIYTFLFFILTLKWIRILYLKILSIFKTENSI